MVSRLKDSDISLFEKEIIESEGLVPYAYKDSEGYTTIGVGRNIDQKGGNHLSTEEILYLLRNDLERCEDELRGYKFFDNQEPQVQEALIEMVFNMGLPRFLSFKKMLRALADKDFRRAVVEARDSKWATQVGPLRVARITAKFLCEY